MSKISVTSSQRTELLNAYLKKYIAQYLSERFMKDPPESDRFHIGVPIVTEIVITADPLSALKDEVSVTFKMACRMK